MRSCGALRYQQFCYRLTVYYFFVSAGFILLFNLISINQIQKSSLWNNYLVGNGLLAAFCGSFCGIYKQRETRHYKKAWLLFAVIFGINYSFLFMLLAMTINQTGRFNQLTIGFKNMVIICFGCLACFVASRAVYKIKLKAYFVKIFLSFLLCYVLAIFLTNNTYWWHSSICALGVPSNQNYQIYNFTLILMASMMSLLVYYLYPQLSRLKTSKILNKPKIIVLGLLYFMDLLALALIGIFPYGINQQINQFHMFLGFFVFFDLGVIMLLAGWLFNKFPKKYLQFNYFIFLFASLSYFIGFKTTLLPFTLTEALTLLTIIFWLIATLKNINKLNLEASHQASTLSCWQYNY